MRDHNVFPVIRLEIEHMKRSIMAVLTEHAAQMDEDIKAAVDAYCTKENLQAVVRQAATVALDAAIKEEVRRFFDYGSEGRKAVAEAVRASILNNKTYTPIDSL